MKAIKLDYYTSWKSLPWNHIEERILIIQKKIYQTSKACKYHSIHKAQNTLINSNEAKVLAVEEIFKSLSKSSLDYNENYYRLNDNYKLLVFYSLFEKQNIYGPLIVLKEKVKQYLIYLCLQPEWEARFEPILQSNLGSQGSYLLQDKLTNFLDYKLNLPKNWQGIYLEYRISNKYIDYKYIKKRIQSGICISHYLNSWLDSNYIEEFAEDFISTSKFNALHKLLYRIIANGIEWFYYMELEPRLKSKQYDIYENLVVYYQTNTSCWFYVSNDFIINLTFILKFLGLNINKYNIYYAKHKNCIFYIPYFYKFNILLDTNDISKLLFKLVKYSIYTKDFINRLRVNNHINILKAISNISKLILQFYNYYSLLMPLRILKYMYQEVDCIFYSWLKKRNKSKYLIKLIIRRNKKYIIKSLIKCKYHVVQKICVEKFNRW